MGIRNTIIGWLGGVPSSQIKETTQVNGDLIVTKESNVDFTNIKINGSMIIQDCQYIVIDNNVFNGQVKLDRCNAVKINNPYLSEGMVITDSTECTVDDKPISTQDNKE